MAETCVAPRAHGPLFAPAFGVAVEEGTVQHPGLLGVGHAWRFAVVRIGKHVPHMASHTKGGDIAPSRVGRVALGFAIRNRPVLLIRQRVVPYGWRGWYRNA